MPQSYPQHVGVRYDVLYVGCPERHLGDTTSVTSSRSRTSASRCRSVAVGPRRPVHGFHREPLRAAARV